MPRTVSGYNKSAINSSYYMQELKKKMYSPVFLKVQLREKPHRDLQEKHKISKVLTLQFLCA